MPLKVFKYFKHEFKISLYADVTSLYIQPDEKPLYECMKLLDSFSLVSGLTINIEKTKVITIGAWRDSRIILCPELKLDWTYGFESLGITYDVLDMSEITEMNLKSSVKENKQIIKI